MSSTFSMHERVSVELRAQLCAAFRSRQLMRHAFLRFNPIGKATSQLDA